MESGLRSFFLPGLLRTKEKRYHSDVMFLAAAVSPFFDFWFLRIKKSEDL